MDSMFDPRYHESVLHLSITSPDASTTPLDAGGSAYSSRLLLVASTRCVEQQEAPTYFRPPPAGWTLPSPIL